MKPFATANTKKILCSVGRMDAYAGCARRGTAARDNATLARRIKLWPAEDRQRRQGGAWRVPVWRGEATQARHGRDWRGAARRGNAGRAGTGKARSGTARQRRHGVAWRGGAGRGEDTTQTGGRDRGINCAHFLSANNNQPKENTHG